MIIAVLGAPGTGKTSLIESLRKVFQSEHLLRDSPPSGAARAAADLTLLMGLDLPWRPDQSQQDSSAARGQVDACLRAELMAQGVRFVVVYGHGPARTLSALQAIGHHAGQPDPGPIRKSMPWQWNCEKCSDGGCEHRMFTGLLKASAPNRLIPADQ